MSCPRSVAVEIAPILNRNAASVTTWTNSRPGSYRIAWRRIFAAITCWNVSGGRPSSSRKMCVAAISRMYAAVCR
jgi:hypothetical protein